MPPKVRLAKITGNPVSYLRVQLNHCKGRWMLLTEMSNGAFSYKWLIAFAEGRIDDPGFSKVVELGKLLGMKIEAVAGPHALRPHG